MPWEDPTCNKLFIVRLMLRGLGFKQYRPLNPVKREIKVCVRTDTTNGFFNPMQIYTGKRSTPNWTPHQKAPVLWLLSLGKRENREEKRNKVIRDVVDIKMRKNREIKKLWEAKNELELCINQAKKTVTKTEQLNSLTDDQPLERDQSTKSTVPKWDCVKGWYSHALMSAPLLTLI